MLSKQQDFPSCVSEEQWESIKDFLLPTSRRGRKRSVNLRDVFNAILYIVRTGCAWRYLPKEFPNPNTVYDYFRKWQRQGLFEKICDQLVEKVRVNEGKDPQSSVIIIDSQATKAQFGEARGYDGFKKVRGRKRNIIVDSLGLPIKVFVDPAGKKDHRSALEMFAEDSIASKLVGVTDLFADGGYRCDVDWFVRVHYGITTHLKSSTTVKTHTSARVLTESSLKPIRWIVERTFAWLNHFRRLSRDYERTTKSSESMVYLASIRMMLTRLTRTHKLKRWIKRDA